MHGTTPFLKPLLIYEIDFFDLGIVWYGMVRRGTKVVRRDGIGIQNLISDFEEASG